MGLVYRMNKGTSGLPDWLHSDPTRNQFLDVEINTDLKTIYDEFNGSIDANNLANLAVTSPKINTLAVGEEHLQEPCVTTLKVTDDAITSPKINDADGTSGQDTTTGSGIKRPHIQQYAINSSKIDTGEVNNRCLANPSVNYSEIYDDAVVPQKLRKAYLYEAERTISNDIDTESFSLILTGGDVYPTKIPLMPYVVVTAITGSPDIQVDYVNIPQQNAIVGAQYYCRIEVKVWAGAGESITYQVKWPAIST